MKKNKRTLLLVISIVLLIGIYYYLNYKFGFSIPCLFHKVTNLYCPGCGITRMIFSLLKLELYQAFRYNQLLFISLPFSLVLIGDFFVKCFFDKDNYLYKKINNKIWSFLLIIVLVFGILRNIPGFEFLRPIVI